MILSSVLHLNDHIPKIDWGASVWIFPYMIGMTLISYFGSFPGPVGVFGGVGVFKNILIGGNGDLPLWWDLLLLAAFSLVIYYIAIGRRLPKEAVEAYVSEVASLPVVHGTAGH
jgi:hypothetical protein